MYRIAVAALFAAVATTGCATTGGGGTNEGNASISGVVSLPQSGLQRSDDPCGHVEVKVARADGRAVGDPSMKLSRGRCAYLVSGVPSDTDLTFTVTPASSWKCDSGAAPTITPATQTLKLRSYQTAARDFAVSCG